MNGAFITHSSEETKVLGKQIAEGLLPGTLVCLGGDLGAGKTTLTQGILEGFGADRPYVSPTFVIMKQYDLSGASRQGIERIYHADAYRVEEKDFRDLGFKEWCEDKRGLVILEWPERIRHLLPEKRVDVVIKSLSESEREITIK